MELNSNLEVSELIRKYKNNILQALIILAAVFIALNIYQKQVKEIDSLNAQKEMEARKNAEFEVIKGLEKKNDFLKNYLARKDPGLTINAVTEIAKELGVKVTSVRPEQEIKFAQYIKAPFEISFFASDYHDIGMFVNKIENAANVYIIENISVKRDSRSKGLLVSLRFSSIVLN